MVPMVFAIIIVAMLVAVVVLFKMWINGMKAGDTLWLPSPSVVTASYNSKNLRIFAACFLVAATATILLIVLFLMGYSKHI